MNHNEQLAQSYLDALDDPQCFCDGRPFSFAFVSITEPITMQPTCSVRHQCAMFGRQPRFGKPIRRWNARGKPETGCDGYVAWEREKKWQAEQEQVDQMAWEITMADRTFEVKKCTLNMALFNVATHLVRDGMPIETAVQMISQNQYSVRDLSHGPD